MNTVFDTIAPDYDATFTERPLGRCLRDSVWMRLDAAFGPGDRVLDLGCGTGEDAVHLAGRGVQVGALDSSPRILDIARRKAEMAGVTDLVSFTQFDLNDSRPSELPVPRYTRLDGAYSNFGALNCVSDRKALARLLAGCIRRGGRLVLVLMGPYCPWEWLWFAPRFQFRKAGRRLRGTANAQMGNGTQMPVYYPSVRTLRREFAPWFRFTISVGIGVLLPPTFAANVVESRPALLQTVTRWDRRIGPTPPGRWLNDHYLAVFERTAGYGGM